MEDENLLSNITDQFILAHQMGASHDLFITDDGLLDILQGDELDHDCHLSPEDGCNHPSHEVRE